MVGGSLASSHDLIGYRGTIWRSRDASVVDGGVASVGGIRRAGLLWRWQELSTEHADLMAHIPSREQGKPLQ